MRSAFFRGILPAQQRGDRGNGILGIGFLQRQRADGLAPDVPVILLQGFQKLQLAREELGPDLFGRRPIVALYLPALLVPHRSPTGPGTAERQHFALRNILPALGIRLIVRRFSAKPNLRRNSQ
jgi:hypothetical protein